MFAFSFFKKPSQMKQNISLQELIATNNPSKAKALVVKYGYRPARNYNDLIHKLFQLTREHREDALKDLVDIHPHKDLILHYAMPIPVATETKSNCDGDTMCPVCTAKAKEKYMNFEGDVANTTNQNVNSDWKAYLPLIAITSLVTASLVVALKSSR
jgi:hypothetical protein